MTNFQFGKGYNGRINYIRKYKCKYCDEMFRLKATLMTHTSHEHGKLERAERE